MSAHLTLPADSALPGFSLLMDPIRLLHHIKATRPWLSPRLPSAATLQVMSSRYHPRRRLTRAFGQLLATREATPMLVISTFAQCCRDRFQRVFSRWPHNSFHLPEINAIGWLVPAEPKLNLELLTQPAALQAVCDRLTASSSFAIASIDPAHYLPGQGLTVRINTTDTSTPLYVKFRADDQGAATHRNMQLLRTSATHEFSVSHSLGFDAATRSHWQTGLPLVRPAFYEEIAPALTALHRSPIIAPTLTDTHFVTALSSATRVITTVFPELSSRVTTLCNRLLALAPWHQAALATLHQDIHPGNVLLGENRQVSFIDLDDLCVGPAAADLGSAIAQGISKAVTAGADLQAAHATYEQIAADLARYRTPNQTPVASKCLRQFTAFSLLSQRAKRPITRLKLSHPRHLITLLEAADALLV